MLKVWYGDKKPSNYEYEPESYFDSKFDPNWMKMDIIKEAILDIDKSKVLAPYCIESPVFGQIPPKMLSGGVKTLIFAWFDKSKVFNMRQCGENCCHTMLKWGQIEDFEIYAGYPMFFYDDNRDIGIPMEIMNTGKVVNNRADFLRAYAEVEQ